MVFYYNKTSNWAKELLKNSKIREMSYTPHFLALNGNMQSFVYLFTEMYTYKVYPYKYEREIITLSDGGTIALDWVID